jgi:hypothetical protein
MKDPEFLATQQAEARTAPHILAVNDFVEGIQDPDGRGWVPRIAPHHAGLDARVLSILRDPGPRAHFGRGSGFLSVENDDATAARQAELFAANGIAVRDVLPWNAYPWFIDAQPTAEQSTAGAHVLVDLLPRLRRLEVVLLQGRDAEAVWKRVLRIAPDIVDPERVVVFATIHPSRGALRHPDKAVQDERKGHQEETYRQVGEALAARRPPDSVKG